MSPRLAPQDREHRILKAKLRVLYQGVFAIPTNFLVGAAVVWMLRESYPTHLLIIWAIATVIVAGARMELHRRFTKAAAQGLENPGRWRIDFCIGSAASGLLWSVLFMGLPVYGRPEDYVLLSIVAAGMSAGALTTLSSYFPAFASYSLAILPPLIVVCAISQVPHVAGISVLILLYTVMVCAAALKLNNDVSRTIALQIDNEALNTDLVQARAERDSARNEKWSTIAHLSHELRTPLNAILGFNEVMKTRLFGPLGDAHYDEYVEHIHSSSKHLLNLITEILHFSQSEDGRLALNDDSLAPAPLIADCLQEVAARAEAAHIALRTEVANDLPWLRGDAFALRQVIVGLASNAIKFTHAGGAVAVKAQRTQEGGIEIRVEDNGIGMTEEEIAVALEPFGRVADPLHYGVDGMGLGLPFAKRLVELHEATLKVDSVPDRGTVCTVAFPPTRTIAPGKDEAGTSVYAA